MEQEQESNSYKIKLENENRINSTCFNASRHQYSYNHVYEKQNK